MPSFHVLQPLVPMLSAVLAALLIDVATRMLAGNFRDRLDPLLGIPARCAARLHAKLNRLDRPRPVRALRGAITLILMALIGFVLAIGLMALSRSYSFAEPLIWWACLHLTFPWTAGNELLKAGAKGSGLAILERRRIHALVPTKNPDRHAILRMLIESTATSLHTGGLTAIFWAAVASYFGIEPIAVAVFVTVLLESERVIVTAENANSPFAQGFEIVEAVLNFVPARISGLLWVLASFFTPNAKPGTAARCMFNQGEKHFLINSGWPIAAVAGALRIALPAGRSQGGWIGGTDATAKVTDGDLQRALWLHGVVIGLVVLIFTAMIFLGLGS